tara:strand:+ start:227 stop:553 length:327 start_codon:yes stop_codon:yes gene_type:complete
MFNIQHYFKSCVEDIIDDIPQDWENTSYYNDLLPSYQCNNFMIWIAHGEISKRDYETKDFSRFIIEPLNDHNELICFDGSLCVNLEDLQDVIELVSKPHNHKEQWGVK